jgi:paraquat-inducible protein B
VRSIGIEYQRDKKAFRMPVVVELYPSRIGLSAHDLADKPHARGIADVLNKRGLRAQLRTGNLLTGQVYVALDFFPKEKPVKFDPSANPIQLPTVQNSLDEIQSQVQEIAAKVNKIPFEEISNDLRKTLRTLDKTLTAAESTVTRINNDVTPEIAAAMKDARKTINSADRTLAEDSPLQQDLRQTLQELTRTAGSIRVLTDYLERHPESLLRGKPDDTKK